MDPNQTNNDGYSALRNVVFIGDLAAIRKNNNGLTAWRKLHSAASSKDKAVLHYLKNSNFKKRSHLIQKYISNGLTKKAALVLIHPEYFGTVMLCTAVFFNSEITCGISKDVWPMIFNYAIDIKLTRPEFESIAFVVIQSLLTSQLKKQLRLFNFFSNRRSYSRAKTMIGTVNESRKLKTIQKCMVKEHKQLSELKGNMEDAYSKLIAIWAERADQLVEYDNDNGNDNINDFENSSIRHPPLHK